MKKQIITISRQSGSGGYLIGRELSERLGIPLYDKFFVEANACQGDDSAHSCTSLLFSLATGTYDGYLLDKPTEGDPTTYQGELVRRLADQGPCVFVGRCADYFLRGREDCLRIFLRGDMADRIERLVTRDGLTPDSAQRLAESRDAMRARHYNFLTDGVWGDPANYDLVLDSSELGLEACVEQILAACESCE